MLFCSIVLVTFMNYFYEDAIKASQILELTLTSRNRNADDPIPMCGVPHHAAQGYIDILIEKGYKVAICEQVEDPKTTKGMVKREVINWSLQEQSWTVKVSFG